MKSGRMKERDLERVTIAEIAPRIKSKELSPRELTLLFLERIKRINPSLNAYMTLMEEQALTDARAAETEILAGNYRGPLHGIPFSIKDNLAIKGIRTTAGSKILADWKPDMDATVVTRLKDAGAIILGKTNMHEWASGGTTINPYFGATLNPWDEKRVPGGSSGGSAAAVAASICLGSIGTDNMGSVRNPASMCGIVGLKATYGRVSRFGGVAGTGGFSTDHFGVLAKTVTDSAFVLQAIAGHDPGDPLSADEPVPDYSKSIGKGLQGMKFGLIPGFGDDLMAGDVKNLFAEAVRVFESLGMKREEVSIPHLDLVQAVHTCVSRIESVCAHEHFLRTRPRDYSPAILYRNILTLTIPATTYVNAQMVRRIISREFNQALEKVDVLVTPMAMPAPTIDECNRGYVEVEGKTLYLQDPTRGSLWSVFSIPFNLTGLPALSLCCGFSSLGLPIGLQIAAGPFQESTVFQVAHAYEQATQWSKKAQPEL